MLTGLKGGDAGRALDSDLAECEGPGFKVKLAPVTP
jgi:hypothetical protein